MVDNDNDKPECDQCYVQQVFNDRLVEFLKALLSDDQKLALIDWLKYSKNPFAGEDGVSN